MPTSSIKPQFIIKSAILTKDNPNFNKRSLEIDLTNSVLELSIFESLDIPYLSGNMTVKDNDGIFSDMAFQGTERIEFVLGT